jgi:hypothetical protein
MTARELIDNFFQRTRDDHDLRLFARLLLHNLADHWHALRLADGQRVNDNSDGSLALRELAEAALAPIPGKPPIRDHTCPDCGHEHEAKEYCSKYLGEGKFCQCESRVTA